MQFYTSFHARGGSLRIRGFRNGKRFKEIQQLKPYLFVPSENGLDEGYRTLHGRKVKKLDLGTVQDARDFIERHKDIENFQLYGLSMFHYVHINDLFKEESISFDESLIRVGYLDIEVASDGGFPSIELADKEVTAISLGFNDKIYAFGTRDYSPEEGVHYLKCANEFDLLEKFIKLWKVCDLDVVTGWNVEFFDVPYLIRRIERVLSMKAAEELSPWNVLSEKEVRFQSKVVNTPSPLGVVVLDYLQMYKKFAYTPQESYRLDHIAEYELGEKKLDYSEYDSLNELYKKNYQKFIAYNVHDVRLVLKLEAKLGFISQVFAIAYDSKINYEDAFTTVRLWDIITHNYLMTKKTVVPYVDFDSNEEAAGIIGGYVKDPQIGLHEWVLSFDLTSLYPMIIQQYNISPETYRGMIDVQGSSMEDKINFIVDGGFDDPTYGYFKDMKEKNVTITPVGCMFDRDFPGFFPVLMSRVFDQRDVYKKEMLKAKKELEKDPNNVTIKNRIAKFKNLQQAKKIQLNSAFGAFANRFFRWYEPKFAESITSCGQVTTRWIEKSLNRYLNELLKTKDVDYIIACDTDSVYIRMKEVIDQVCSITDKERVTNYLDIIAKQQLQPYINSEFERLAEYMNAYQQKMSMKRESIADKGIWTGKKHYILNNWDEEGVRYTKPKLKLMGIEAVRSSTPVACKKLIKSAIDLIMNGTQDQLLKFIEEQRVEFRKQPFEDIAFPRGVNGLQKYSDSKTLYRKGTPIHTRAALKYNELLQTHNLLNKYEAIMDGEKIKFCYLLMPNPICENVIGVKHTLPLQFELQNYVDYDMQFEKGFLTPIKTITNAIGWDAERTNTLEDLFR